MESLIAENQNQTSELHSYVYDIYNNSMKMCSESCTPNNYYLPALSDYVINLLLQLPAWTNVAHKIFGGVLEIVHSANSECFFRNFKNEY